MDDHELAYRVARSSFCGLPLNECCVWPWDALGQEVAAIHADMEIELVRRVGASKALAMTSRWFAIYFSHGAEELRCAGLPLPQTT